MNILRALAVPVLSCVCLSGLQSCATPYQSAKGSFTGGFGETRISDSAYWVYFSGNGYAQKSRVIAFWLNRCAELTVQHGFQYMVLRTGENAPVGLLGELIKPAVFTANGSHTGAHSAVYYPGNAAQLVPVRGGGTYVTIYGGGGGATKWSSKGTVLMYPAPLPQELVWAYDAQKVLDLLKPYVSSNGAGPTPALDEIARESVVAHEQIGFTQSAPPVAAPFPSGTPEKPSGAASAKPPRSVRRSQTGSRTTVSRSTRCFVSACRSNTVWTQARCP